MMMTTLSLYWSSYALGARASTESHRSANPSILLRKQKFASPQMKENLNVNPERIKYRWNKLDCKTTYLLKCIITFFALFIALPSYVSREIAIDIFFSLPWLIQMPNQLVHHFLLICKRVQFILFAQNALSSEFNRFVCNLIFKLILN